MLKLGVNIDHVATLNQARYKGVSHGEPSPVEAAQRCIAAGAHGITAHLREDRRHIQDADVAAIRKEISAPLNFEMANTAEMAGIAVKLAPAWICVVPEKREELTTEGGLDVIGQKDSLKSLIQKMHSVGIQVSLFVDPDVQVIEASAEIQADAVELHTGAFGEAYHIKNRSERQIVIDVEVERLIAAAEKAGELGLVVNAGHGLTVENIPDLKRVPKLNELNIGHSLISRAVMVGLDQSVKEFLIAMDGYNPNPTVF